MANLPKGISYMAVAVVVGLLATLGIHRYVIQKTYIPPVATGKVVVATGDVAPGSPLAAGSLKIVTWPKELIPQKCASAIDQVQGRVAIMPIATGEPILFSKLAPVGTAAGLSSLLAENKRAVAVRVDDVTGVAGFIHPQDKVDVLADIKMKGVDESFSKVILQDIRVLSIGQTWQQSADGKPKVVNAVTLALTPEQAEILNLASNEGKIRLALRGERNNATVETSGVALSSLFSKMKKEPESVAADPKLQREEKPKKVVEVIKGLKRSQSNPELPLPEFPLPERKSKG